MAGYRYDYSMSNNAYFAYQDGKAPYSKWNKDMLFDLIAKIDTEKTLIPKLQKYPLNFLKDEFLISSEWHHTSNKFNRTDFYHLDEGMTKHFVRKPETLDFDYNSWKTKQKQLREEKKKEKEKPLKHGTMIYYVLEGEKKLENYVKKKLQHVWVRNEGDWMVAYDGNGDGAKVITRRKIEGLGRPQFFEVEIKEKKEEKKDED